MSVCVLEKSSEVGAHIELGVKGDPAQAEQAFIKLQAVLYGFAAEYVRVQD